jgi:MOSC domain-containing protein YiiM
MSGHSDAAKGRIRSIHTCGEAGAPMGSLPEVRAWKGKGLEGDRYLKGNGTYSKKPGVDREVTLIEAETLRALEAERGDTLRPEETRRNLVTEGIALNPLVGRFFRVGEVQLKGVRLCEPCGYLEQVTGKKVFEALKGRGGLRAQILSGGTIRLGDPVEPMAEPVAKPIPVGAGGRPR